jgi:class 3 adenylate cyclase
MPLFLDRHDIPGVTAVDLAMAHARDVEIEKQYDDGDLFRAAVELAARRCASGDAGGILVSSAVREVCSEKDSSSVTAAWRS